MSRYDEKIDAMWQKDTDNTPRYTNFAHTQYEYDGRYPQDDDAADYIRVHRMITVVS